MTAEFIAQEGALKGLVLRLEGAEEWTIGRDPEGSNLLVEDPKVSRTHLLCRKTDEGYILENLSSTNPSKVNDLPLVTPQLLHDGDKVTIGGTIFHFYEHGAPQASLLPEGEELLHEELPQETIYRDEDVELPPIHFDLTETSRFILKVIAGPNTGAEFALDSDKHYLIGTDATTCDIVFHDLSVSREHAKLVVGKEGELLIQDLGSRNGVLVDRTRIEGSIPLAPSKVVTMGTSSFIVLDREAPTETIITPFLGPAEEEIEEVPVAEEEITPEMPPVEEPRPLKLPSKSVVTPGTLILAVVVAGMAVLLGIGLVSLFRGQEVVAVPRDFNQELAEALKPFPAVKFTYNKGTGKLFLVGHVSTGVEKSELLYRLQGLTFVHGVDDNVVIDEAIWQDMNLLLASQPDFQGVTLQSPRAGSFVLTGYLRTNKQAAALADYMNLHFNYLNLLDNQVVVEEQVMDEVQSRLLHDGFNGVTPNFSNGELILTGYVSSTKSTEFQSDVDSLAKVPGVRTVRNYVVALSPEQAVVEVNELYPGRFQVTGFSRHNNINVNVVINGRILSRGDTIDGLTITSIQPHTIFLEKDGLKYKIEYNK